MFLICSIVADEEDAEMEATDRDREILETLAELGLEVASALK